MNGTRSRLFRVAFFSCCLAILIIACGSTGTNQGVSSSPTSSAHTPTGGSGTAQPVTTTTAGSLPPGSTSCPPQGTARAAVMPLLTLGSHQNIVYLLGEGAINTFPTSTLKRYDVTTGSTTEIVKMPHVRITEAQVSADGRWILFVAGSKLQMIRMDGQDLQTLYCTSAPATEISGVQWSPDQRQVIFFGGGKPEGEQTLYLLDIARGTVQPELFYTGQSTFYIPRTWIDSKRVYLVGVPRLSSGPEPTPAPVPKLYILDTGNGANQHTNNLRFVAQAQSPYCWDFDSSYDTGKLFIDHCIQLVALGSAGVGLRQGPSSITVQSATGGPSNTVYINPKQAIIAVRVVGYTSASLLLIIENQSDGHVSVDTSQNGLWKINTDGSGLTRLTTENAGDRTSLNRYTQYPWSNFSHDGSMYAARIAAFQGNSPPAYSLVFGSLSGGTPTMFASVPHPGEVTQLELAGWTTM